MSVPPPWTFFRAGGFDQVELTKGAELVALKDLDQKLWVALACPTAGVELDPRFLALLDTDQDGRIRAPELLQAIEFIRGALKHPDELTKGSQVLALSEIDETSDSGQRALAVAAKLLQSLGKTQAGAVSLADFAEFSKVFSDKPFNGDGVVVELSASDESSRAVIRDIIACLGPELDRSGKPGIDQAKTDVFFTEVEAACAWHTAEAAAKSAIGELDANLADEAVRSFLAIRVKVDDYFARCRLAAFDPRLSPLLNRQESEYAGLVSKTLSASAAEAAEFPLSQVAAARALPLWGVVNPAYLSDIRKLHDGTIVPLLGYRDELTNAEWDQITEKLTPYLAWLAAKPVASVEPLGTARLLELKDSSERAKLLELIAQDKAQAAEAQHFEELERLVHYYCSLYKLCTNFVNFQDFYNRKTPAIFQCGTLYIDQRACTLCLRVSDPAKHAALAGLAGAYLAYVDCVRKDTTDKMQIVAVITNGDSDNLMVGRNGLFYDNQGRDYDATITKIVDNPISVRQAFFAPYKKLVRMIEEQVAKRASDADSSSTAELGAVAASTAHADRMGKADAAKKPIEVGVVAALGVAVAGIGTFFTAIMGYASGWAINSQAKINVPFGTTLTSVSKLPAGSRRTSGDAFAEKGLPWKRYVLLFFVVYGVFKWFEGSFDALLPKGLTPHGLLGLSAPSAPEPAPPPQ